MTVTVATFYKFFTFPDYREQQVPLLNYCQTQGIKGTILLASEGINATLAGTENAIASVLDYLRSDPRLHDLDVKLSYAETPPFERLKVRLKKEIVTFGHPEVDPTQQVGQYVPPQGWNQLISDPEVVVIDTRNDYEVKIGTFTNARNPQTRSFREFPDYVKQHLDPQKQPKVAMFCTGGIRCEKATAYLLKQGFQEVYHLQGGILRYLAEIPPEESLWQGECFVFDERIAVEHGLEPGSYGMCSACGHPLSPAEQESPAYEPGIACPYCAESTAVIGNR
ncbi:rhodanese-related sulfurtransferase [Spirulina subsalsa FACHB-351]|uniref:tRNA uridine(34) hydroxylase n=1 Tax=Spirulina subsalsa FACHB-351 TaxID=234711 RepID=A0ABT3L6C2_9CYAN|nr:rhodanese-related sulfurtransferase [Spirulina subsalsa]MCW6037035.1 rhodanese-related sulfurtransferase [Spirulina subsalsa FACHB-351]